MRFSSYATSVRSCPPVFPLATANTSRLQPPALSEVPLDKKVRNAKKKLRQVEEKTGNLPGNGELTQEQARGPPFPDRIY